MISEFLVAAVFLLLAILVEIVVRLKCNGLATSEAVRVLRVIRLKCSHADPYSEEWVGCARRWR
ncbi:hypothetical protein D9M69_656500 [compost metagenome]